MTQPSNALVPKPAKGVAVRAPIYGSCVVRATDHANEAPSGFARNHYSRVQPFNADDSMFFVYALDGFWHVYSTSNQQYLKRLNGLASDAEPFWHPTDPDKLYFSPTYGGMEIRLLTVSTNAWTVAANFSGRLPWTNAARVWSKAEGAPSADGKIWCFQVETENFNPLGLMSYNMETDTILGTLNFTQYGLPRPDHTSTSASGEYCVPSWIEPVGTRAYKVDFSNADTPIQLHPTSEHSDLGFGADGEDYYVALDYQSNDGDFFMRNIRTGVRTNLFTTYGGSFCAYHVSAKNFDKPGWVLVSTYAGSGVKWFQGKLFAVELKANPRVYILALHNATVPDYWGEPHAAVNRDFTKVLYNSNYGTTQRDPTNVDAYMIQIPATAIPSVGGAPRAASAPVRSNPPTQGTPPTSTSAPTGAPSPRPAGSPVPSPAPSSSSVSPASHIFPSVLLLLVFITLAYVSM